MGCRTCDHPLFQSKNLQHGDRAQQDSSLIRRANGGAPDALPGGRQKPVCAAIFRADRQPRLLHAALHRSCTSAL